MLTDESICELQENICTRYNEDIAQSVVVEILKNRDNETIRSWVGWTRRAAYRFWLKEKKEQALFDNLDEAEEETLADKFDLEAVTDAVISLKAILKHKEAVELVKYFTGEKGFSRQWCNMLRNKLVADLK